MIAKALFAMSKPQICKLICERSSLANLTQEQLAAQLGVTLILAQITVELAKVRELGCQIKVRVLLALGSSKLQAQFPALFA